MTDTNGNGTATGHANLMAALIAAQADMPAVEPDSINPHFKSKFVSLGHLLAKTRPVLNRHGLAVSQWPSLDEGGRPTLVTVLAHKSGESMQFAAPLMLTKQDPQGQGSAITYMRRYALAAVLGIGDQEDDDGNAGSQPNGAQSHASASEPVLLTDEQRERVIAALDEKATTAKARKTLLGAAGITDETQITVAQAHALKAAMDS